MKYLNFFEAKKTTKKEVADDIHESIMLIFSYFIDDYKDLVSIKKNLNYINIYASNPCTSTNYKEYSEQVQKWAAMLSSIDEIGSNIKIKKDN